MTPLVLHPPAGLRWSRGVLVAGHGVASGRAVESPYPAGTIALQVPVFLAHGLDLRDCFSGTLNLDFSPGEWRLGSPDHHLEHLGWTDRHPPETFSFWRCWLRRCPSGAGAPPPAAAHGGAVDPAAPTATAGDGTPVAAWIYYPHPETKRAHYQPPAVLEVLAPPLAPVSVGACWELGHDPRRCRLVEPARLRARLLEFFKFRVLAAQEAFFIDAGPPELRRWLTSCWPEALDLSDADLVATLEQARQLYGGH